MNERSCRYRSLISGLNDNEWLGSLSKNDMSLLASRQLSSSKCFEISNVAGTQAIVRHGTRKADYLAGLIIVTFTSPLSGARLVQENPSSSSECPCRHSICCQESSKQIVCDPLSWHQMEWVGPYIHRSPRPRVWKLKVFQHGPLRKENFIIEDPEVFIVRDRSQWRRRSS